MRQCVGWLRVLTIICAFGEFGVAQVARVSPAPFLQLPGVADSNSPSHWTGDKLVMFNSDGMPLRSEGDSIANLGRSRATRFYTYDHVPMWIEATYKAPDGTLYAWYHHEIFSHCPDNPVSTPVIGALRSDDDGLTFFDLGIVISPSEEPNCATRNRYFAGGTGDFTAIPDNSGEYIYLIYSNYSGPATQQGIAIARIAITDLNDPVGKVFKHYLGEWIEPGLGGVETPIFAASADWSSDAADAVWGPSVHWNAHLERFVMVMNHTCCSTDWPQDGIYISYALDLANPATWTQPTRLLDGGGWYPMLMGLSFGDTDKLSSGSVRLFMGSDSHYAVDFDWEEEEPKPEGEEARWRRE